MKLSVTLLPDAVSEFNDSSDWYEARQVGLGVKLVSAVEEAIDLIASAPTRQACVYKELRLISVKGFPCQLYYRVLNEDVLEVVSIFHVRQNPEIWRRRV